MIAGRNIESRASAIEPLINLGTQHDGRSAWTWMKRVLTTFVVVMGGGKGFAREHLLNLRTSVVFDVKVIYHL